MYIILTTPRKGGTASQSSPTARSVARVHLHMSLPLICQTVAAGVSAQSNMTLPLVPVHISIMVPVQISIIGWSRQIG